MSNVPRYLWPLDHQRQSLPFNDPKPIDLSKVFVDTSGNFDGKDIQKAFDEEVTFSFKKGDKVSFQHLSDFRKIEGEILTVGTLFEDEEKMAVVQEFGTDRAYNVYVSRLAKLLA